MGQGRHIRPLIGCILLIVSTIQGITPDSRDLASPFAIALLGPFLVDRHAPFDDDHSPSDPCQAVRDSGPWQDHRQDLQCRTGYPAPTHGRVVTRDSCVVRTGLSLHGERPLAPDLSLTLCRLVC